MLPYLIKPEIFEIQKTKVDNLLRRLKRKRIKKVLIFSDFDREGVNICKTLEPLLKQEGFLVLSHARESLFYILKKLRIIHIEDIKEIASELLEYVPFHLYINNTIQASSNE